MPHTIVCGERGRFGVRHAEVGRAYRRSIGALRRGSAALRVPRGKALACPAVALAKGDAFPRSPFCGVREKINVMGAFFESRGLELQIGRCPARQARSKPQISKSTLCSSFSCSSGTGFAISPRTTRAKSMNCCR